MDFLDFEGNVGPHDYHLPRMSHIRNEDFLHVVKIDRNMNSEKSYGVLPVRVWLLNHFFSNQFSLFPSFFFQHLLLTKFIFLYSIGTSLLLHIMMP
jgi:hypothetical protein